MQHARFQEERWRKRKQFLTPFGKQIHFLQEGEGKQELEGGEKCEFCDSCEGYDDQDFIK